jgi:glucan phosphoethanolaminetransferase (alkaline phosphatase superfamily)
LIFKVVVQVCNPTRNGGVFPLLHILTSMCYLLNFFFFALAILMSRRWSIRVVLTCISLMTKGVEHFFKCFLAIEDFSARILCLDQ